MLPVHICTHFNRLVVCFQSRNSMTFVVQTTMFIVSVLKRKRPALPSHRNRHRAKAATIDSRPPSVSHQPLAAMFSQPKITEKRRGGGAGRQLQSLINYTIADCVWQRVKQKDREGDGTDAGRVRGVGDEWERWVKGTLQGHHNVYPPTTMMWVHESFSRQQMDVLFHDVAMKTGSSRKPVSCHVLIFSHVSLKEGGYFCQNTFKNEITLAELYLHLNLSNLALSSHHVTVQPCTSQVKYS